MQTFQEADNINVSACTDKYFSNTKTIIERFGDTEVTYAFFIRRPVLSATRLAVEWAEHEAKLHAQRIHIEVMHEEGHGWGRVSHCFILRVHSRFYRSVRRSFCKSSARHVSRRTMPMKCAKFFPMFRFWRWMRGIARELGWQK